VSDLQPDRRRRIGWRWPAGIVGACVAVSVVAGVLLHERFHPPDCEDRRTLVLVHQWLTERAGLPESVGLENIRTVAGGPIGFRYVCEADLGGFPADRLPSGAPVPAAVRYVSLLSADGGRQAVTVSVRQRLFLVPAE